MRAIRFWACDETDRRHDVGGEFPAAEQLAADFGMVDAEEFLLGFEQRLLVLLGFVNDLGVSALQGVGEDNFADVVQEGCR